ncbi:MAG TPA: nitroreductase family protein [Acidimicrobiales bacterium]|nr:nitroreductase family protein [Acidimicrobiales bacterium]
MELREVLRRRRMVRDFEPRPVPADVVERVLASAARAPSAGFTQGWDLMVLEGPEQTGSFWAASAPDDGGRARSGWPGVMRAPLLIVVLSSQAAYRARYAESDKAHLDLGAGEWPVPWWHVDAAFASLLMLLTAVDEGLGALFFAVSDVDGLRARFAIPSSHAPVGAIAMGYARPDRPSSSVARGHRRFDQVVHRGHW